MHLALGRTWDSGAETGREALGTPVCFRAVWTLGHPTNNTLQEGKSNYAYNFCSGLKIELCFQIGFYFSFSITVFADLWSLWSLKVHFLGRGHHICVTADSHYLNPFITSERFIFPSPQS